MSTLNISNIIFLQLLLEMVLFILLVLILWRAGRGFPPKSPRRPEELTVPIENFLAEAKKVSQSFDEALKDKKEMSTELILKLDKRLAKYQTLLKQTEASLAEAQKKAAELRFIISETAPASYSDSTGDSGRKANPAAAEARALVLRLTRQGCSPEEIASKTKLRLGEVELIIDLECRNL